MRNNDPRTLALQLQADGYFDNEVDAQLAAIKILAAAGSLESSHPSAPAENDAAPIECDAAADADPDDVVRRYERQAVEFRRQSQELERMAAAAWQCAERARTMGPRRERANPGL